MRTTIVFCLICFATMARLAAQAPQPPDSVFERIAARYYAASGMERFKVLDTIFPALSFSSFERTAGLLKEAMKTLEKADIPAAERAQLQSKTCRRIGLNYKSLARVSEVAYATGFSNPSSFSRAFKSFFGKNPSAMKRDAEQEAA